MHSKLDSILSALLTVSAIVIAGVLLRREFATTPAAATAATREPVEVAQWMEVLSAGVRIGDPSAPVTIAAFSDFECPFCRRFHDDLTRLKARHGDRMSFVFVHFPLERHRFARPAARAAECAQRAGRFGPFLDVVFAQQDSLGLKPWGRYAHDAGIADTAFIQRCATDTAHVARIEAGVELGARVGIPGTPTIMVNGWRLPGVPAEERLSEVVSDLLAGKGAAQVMEDRFPD